MRPSNNCELLLSYFSEKNNNNKCIPFIKFNKTTQKVLFTLYQEIKQGYDYVQSLKRQRGTTFYMVEQNKIENVNDIPKPSKFPASSFPEDIRKHIDETATISVCYTFSLFDRIIKIYFVLETMDTEHLDAYVDRILYWLYIANKHASKKCSKELKIYIFLTSLQKRLPFSNVHILSETHVNSAFTSSCTRSSEIVVFRKEEWFKVLIHETMHNLGLDFSDMENVACNEFILTLFPVKSDVNLYEAYTEFWAETMNSLFCSFFILKDKNDASSFLRVSEFFINMERVYSFFQLAKVLDFMGLQYKNLYGKDKTSIMLRDTFYKENTNVLAYYIIHAILICYFPLFLSWCKNNNPSLLQFNKTREGQQSLCSFIERHYMKPSMLDHFQCMDMFYRERRKNLYQKDSLQDTKMHYIFTNMRMTLCDLDD